MGEKHNTNIYRLETVTGSWMYPISLQKCGMKTYITEDGDLQYKLGCVDSSVSTCMHKMFLFQYQIQITKYIILWAEIENRKSGVCIGFLGWEGTYCVTAIVLFVRSFVSYDFSSQQKPIPNGIIIQIFKPVVGFEQLTSGFAVQCFNHWVKQWILWHTRLLPRVVLVSTAAVWNSETIIIEYI